MDIETLFKCSDMCGLEDIDGTSEYDIKEYNTNDGHFDWKEFSNEAYFGEDNPLANCLDNGVKKLRELIDDKKSDNFDEIKKHLKDWGEEVSRILNCETFKFGLGGSHEVSEAWPSIYIGNDDAVDVNKMTGEVSIDKIKYEQQHKMIETQNGYRFKSPEGKHLFVMISIGIFNYNTVESARSLNDRQIAGTICHEIGHAMEHCVIGALQDAYRKALCFNFEKNHRVTEQSKVIKNDDGMVEIDGQLVINGVGTTYLENLYWITVRKDKKLSSEMEKFQIDNMPHEDGSKSKLKATMSAFTQMFKMAPKPALTKYLEKGGDLANHPTIKAMIASKMLTDNEKNRKIIDNDEIRNDIIKEYRENAVTKKEKEENDKKEERQEKEENKEDEENEKKTENKIIAFSKKIDEIKKKDGSLSKYSRNLVKTVFLGIREIVRKFTVEFVLNTCLNTALIVTGAYIKRRRVRKNYHGVTKEESFADTFASAHGYGDDLANWLSGDAGKNGVSVNNTGTGMKTKNHKHDWMYNIPIFNLFTYFNEYMFDVDYTTIDSYGTIGQRTNRIYIHMKKELEKCKDPKLKKEIENKMEQIKKDYDSLFEGDATRCASYRLFDKIVRKKAFGKDKGPLADLDSKEFKKYILDEMEKMEKSNDKIETNKKESH